MDLLDISAPLSPLKQILKTMQMSGSDNAISIAAHVALAIGMMQQTSYGCLPSPGLPSLEAELTSIAMQAGPQLLCDYRVPC